MSICVIICLVSEGVFDGPQPFVKLLNARVAIIASAFGPYFREHISRYLSAGLSAEARWLGCLPAGRHGILDVTQFEQGTSRLHRVCVVSA